MPTYGETITVIATIHDPLTVVGVMISPVDCEPVVGIIPFDGNAMGIWGEGCYSPTQRWTSQE